MPHTSPATRVLSALVAAALSLGAFVAFSAPASAAPKAPYNYGKLIEPLASYTAQKTCSPVAKPGTSALSKMLLSTYPGSRSLGIVRACSIGGTSEHKEGRAFDWGLSAYSARDRGYADNFLKWALATDKHGNKWANARRLGIQYMIWNKRIWSTSYASSGWRTYTGVSPHTDHIHISLNWDGANKKTSFWTNTVAGKATSSGTAAPATTTKAPSTAVKVIAAPARPKTLSRGPQLSTETVTLKANAQGGVTTKGELVKGQRYYVEVSGTFAWAKGAANKADAECSTDNGRAWKRLRSIHGSDPKAQHLKLYLNGIKLRFAPDTNVGDGCDPGTHVYRMNYSPDRTGRANLRLWDPKSYADNSGSLKIRVYRHVAHSDMTWSVPANAPAGANSPGIVTKGAQYVATVTGTWKTGSYTADAACSVTSRDSRWRSSRRLAAGQFLQVKFQKGDVPLQPVVPPTGDAKCDATTHVYQYAFRSNGNRTINVRVGQLSGYGDNKGSITVRLRRVGNPTGRETVKVNTAKAAGATTSRVYPAGVPLTLNVKGSYTLGKGYLADAECTTAPRDSSWRSTRKELLSANDAPLGDATVQGATLAWQPLAGRGRCNPTRHEYSMTYTPTTSGAIHFGVADDKHDDNNGTLTITVERTK